jgi:hypothetical protein
VGPGFLKNENMGCREPVKATVRDEGHRRNP